MGEPVLVLHGVANRKPKEFDDVVTELQVKLDDSLGESYKLIPVFWGGVGAVTTGLNDTIPGFSDEGSDQNIPGFGPEDYAGILPARNSANESVAYSNHASIIASAAARAMTALPGGESAMPDSAGLEEGIKNELSKTRYLRHTTNAPVLTAVGDTIGRGIKNSRQRSNEIYAVAQLPGDLIGGLLHGADELAGAVLGDAFGTVNHFLRTTFVSKIAEAIGDVFVYEHLRQDIQNRLWKAIDDHAPGYGEKGKPIHVVAHSLGGVIAFQAATTDQGRKLWIGGLVTFGSQSPFFHVIDPKGSVMGKYESGTPLELPTSIESWTNLWEPLDPLAFIARKVFRFSSPDRLRDIPTGHLASTGFWTHSSYWSSPELIDAIRTTLAGVPVTGGEFR